MDLRDVALVALGGAAGCVLRFLVSTWVPTKDFPWATLGVNLAGAFLLGMLVLPSGMGAPWRLLVGVGFFGGFTTLSTFSVEAVDLVRSGHAYLAGASVLANGLGGPLAAALGWAVALLWTRQPPSPA